MVKVGSSFINRISGQSDIDNFIAELDLNSDVVVIKPNWVDGLPCSHTEARALEMFLLSLQKLNKRAIFVESYTFWRTDKLCIQGNKEDYFSSDEATLENGKMHWDFFQKMDKWYLRKEGLGRLFRKFNAEYYNITNAIWEGKVANPSDIAAAVAAKYAPLSFTELYSYVPAELYRYKGSCFVSFAKAKLDTSYGLSLSIKNMFGLIPDPCRAIKYHKDDDKYLVDAIVDINKVYQSLFDMRFVVDGVFTACLTDFDTNTTTPFEDWGIIIGGKDGTETDTIGGILMNGEPQKAMRALPGNYQKVFGGTTDVAVDLLPKEWFLNTKNV